MKKKFVMLLVFVMVISFTGIVFAGPFSDVPSNHWAYGAIEKLYQEGIIEGNQQQFLGNKVLTRYEMAQIVARALEHADKANAQDKTLLDKLSVEFTTELNNLGVRVSKLEASNQSQLKFFGTLENRYTTTAYENKKSMPTSNLSQYRLRLDAKEIVDESTTFAIRIVNNSPYRDQKTAVGLLRNDTWSTYGTQTNDGNNPNTNNTGSIMLDRANFSTKLLGGSATVGRQPLVVGITSAIVDSGAFSFDGVKLTNTIAGMNVSAQFGRFVDKKDITGIELSKKNKNLLVGSGYFEMKDGNNPALSATSLGEYPFKLWYAYGSYLIAPKLSVMAECSKNYADYAENGDPYTNTPGGKNTMYFVQFKYGDQALQQKGQANLIVRYYSIGANALALDNSALATSRGLTTLDTTKTTDRFHSLMFQYNYAFSKSIFSTFDYRKIVDQASSANNFRYYRAALTVMF